MAVAMEMGGIVVDGRRLGRLLGAPTANVVLPHGDASLYGSWAAIATIAARAYRALAHVGVRPSVGGTQPLLEVHLFDFDGNLYGHELRVRLLKKVSDEERLESLDLLRLKIASDLSAVRRYFENDGLDMPRDPTRRRSPGRAAPER
ncbi:MAG: riboflavin kinase [Deltaproteobacteria bacterium]|nr:riboflavin kinase [Deltaproteobacteria bacterium]